jgi:hypothetical protein
VKGGHWQRSFLNPRTPPDDIFKRDWLDGRTHPLTGKPLEIYRPAVAPGTMVSILHREHIDMHSVASSSSFRNHPMLMLRLGLRLKLRLPACLSAGLRDRRHATRSLSAVCRPRHALVHALLLPRA